MKVTEELAKFVVGLEYKDIPEKAISTAQMAITDYLGTTLAGTVQPLGKLITEYVRDMACKPVASVVGSGFKTALPMAALANGTMGHALDYDDAMGARGVDPLIPRFSMHPSVVIAPPILALGEKNGSSGKEVLTAYIAGYEVTNRILHGMTYKHYDMGWHATSTLGTLGAAAACAKLLKLTTMETRMALGIAASRACGLRQNFGTMTKPYHAGVAAENGISAALLSQKGMTADASILESPLGFLNVFAGEKEYDPGKMLQKPSESFAIVSRGLTIKPYPACQVAHRCLDAITQIVKEHEFSADDVEEVVCTTSARYPTVMIHSEPKTGIEGKFSLQYCMAITILDRIAGLEQFTDERVNDPKAQELTRRVKFYHPPGYTRETRRIPKDKVTVKLKNGKEYSAEQEHASGEPMNPMTLEEVIKKYQDCASLALTSQQVEQSLKMLANLEELDNVDKLMKVMGSKGKS